MNDFDFYSDIDDILAEFGASRDADSEECFPDEEVLTDPQETEEDFLPEEYSAWEDDPSVEEAAFGEDSAAEDDFAGEENLQPVMPRRRREPEIRDEARPERSGRKSDSGRRRTEAPQRRSGDRSKQERRITKAELLESAEEVTRKSISGFKRFVLAFTGLVFGAAALIVLAWMLVNIHPDSSMASSQLTAKKRSDIVTRLDAYSNNMKGELLGDLTYIRKQYKIPEGNLVAPLAPKYNYGSTTDPKEVLAVIEEARGYGLLEDQEVIFSENVDFYYDSTIEYYCDETLLVICWKELIENRIVSCVEVKIADGSQIRRKLAEDTYGSSQYVYATELAAQCNAVAAINADYYAFRDLGITVYDRRLYRFDEGAYSGTYDKYNATDTLFVNSSGDFIVFRMGEQSTREDMEKFIQDNNIIFAVAFGPVLVDDWTQQWNEWYPIGEVDKEYSRAGIAQFDRLHYLYMTVSFADNPNEYHPRCTINEFAALMAGKNVRLAYCLDGGQTGEVVFNGKPYNHIDFGTERTVSDIIYFASAIPESER